MEFILAKTAGFCWGVRLALNKTLEVDVGKEGKVTTLGPLVHNPQVVDLLSHRDVHTAKDVIDVDGGLAIIRSHGVSPQVYAELEQRADKILDNTCPIVKRVQKAVGAYARKGHFVVIYGEEHHAEVLGIIGYAGENNYLIIEGEHELDKIPPDRPFILVTQTTTNVQEWQRIMATARERFGDRVVIRDTMCDATTERQSDILEICGQVEAMIVIGGKNSGNTQRLAQIAREEFNLPTWHIETEDELIGVDFTPYARVGVTAGASTPSWSIDRVMAYLKTLEDESKSPVLAKAKRVLETLAVTSVFTSFAAGALCYVAASLQGVPFAASFFWLVFCYVFSMHVLNRFTEKTLDQFRDDPKRARFYEKHTALMKGAGVVSAAVAIGISIAMGVLPFLLILTASVLGLLYSVRVVPRRFAKVRFRRLKDIAASKNFFVASAWAMVTVFPLFFLAEHRDLPATLATFLFLFLATGMRSVIVDLTDMNADRLVGRETIPLVYGEKKTAQGLKYAAGSLAALLVLSAVTGILPPLAGLFGLWVAGEAYYFHRRGYNLEKVSVVRRDLVVDGHFVLAGLIAIAWTLAGLA
ncbi:4-hydroxy-3-methylbut-2-enyl diphosphate reductase [bacterium]|nr:4-hydroxy-3-methylbut-2-enyl diphosphate reductase [bacterium]